MNAPQSIYAPGIEITAPVSPAFAEILTPEALLFIAKLQRGFGVIGCCRHGSGRKGAARFINNVWPRLTVVSTLTMRSAACPSP